MHQCLRSKPHVLAVQGRTSVKFYCRNTSYIEAVEAVQPLKPDTPTTIESIGGKVLPNRSPKGCY